MKKTSPYLIGLILALLYLLYGIGHLIKGLNYELVPSLSRKGKMELTIPDISTRLESVKGIRPRTDLFGKEELPKAEEKTSTSEARLETPEPKTLLLKGIIVTPDGRFRAVIKPEGSKAVTLSVGDEIEGYTLQAVTMTEAILTKNGQTIKLKMYKKSQKEQ